MRAGVAVKPYEIRMVDVTVGHALYSRPGIVTNIFPDGTATVYLLSTKNYSERWQTFSVNSQHPDFPATGLDATSYTIHPPARVSIDRIKSKRGEMKEDLLKAFKEWKG